MTDTSNRVVWGKIHFVYGSASSRKLFTHPYGQLIKFRLSVITPADPSLIGNHYEFVITLMGTPRQFKDARNKLEIFLLVHVTVVIVYHPITVEK